VKMAEDGIKRMTELNKRRYPLLTMKTSICWVYLVVKFINVFFENWNDWVLKTVYCRFHHFVNICADLIVCFGSNVSIKTSELMCTLWKL
jgi:hypothetical protein